MTGLTMKLLLGGLLMVLVLVSELVGLVVLARHALFIEAHQRAQEGSSTFVAAQDDGDYLWVEWEASSCSVWEVRREAERGVSFSESRGGINGGEEEGCREVHVRPHLATTRQPGGVRPASGHRPEPTSENFPTAHFGE